MNADGRRRLKAEGQGLKVHWRENGIDSFFQKLQHLAFRIQPFPCLCPANASVSPHSAEVGMANDFIMVAICDLEQR
jgi:hypothetical protein